MQEKPLRFRTWTPLGSHRFGFELMPAPRKGGQTGFQDRRRPARFRVVGGVYSRGSGLSRSVTRRLTPRMRAAAE